MGADRVTDLHLYILSATDMYMYTYIDHAYLTELKGHGSQRSFCHTHTPLDTCKTLAQTHSPVRNEISSITH